MTNRTLYTTLTASSAFAFLFTLILYALLGGHPLNRVAYGFFVSMLPAFGTFFVLKFGRLRVSWQGALIVYLLLFLLVATLSVVDIYH